MGFGEEYTRVSPIISHHIWEPMAPTWHHQSCQPSSLGEGGVCQLSPLWSYYFHFPSQLFLSHPTLFKICNRKIKTSDATECDGTLLAYYIHICTRVFLKPSASTKSSNSNGRNFRLGDSWVWACGRVGRGDKCKPHSQSCLSGRALLHCLYIGPEHGVGSLFMKSWYRLENLTHPHMKEGPSYHFFYKTGCECRFRRDDDCLFT